MRRPPCPRLRRGGARRARHQRGPGSRGLEAAVERVRTPRGARAQRQPPGDSYGNEDIGRVFATEDAACVLDQVNVA